MGFAISARRDDTGRATHRVEADAALACARAMAREGWGEVRITTEFGESFSAPEFATALQAGRFRPADPGPAARL